MLNLDPSQYCCFSLQRTFWVKYRVCARKWYAVRKLLLACVLLLAHVAIVLFAAHGRGASPQFAGGFDCAVGCRLPSLKGFSLLILYLFLAARKGRTTCNVHWRMRRTNCRECVFVIPVFEFRLLRSFFPYFPCRSKVAVKTMPRPCLRSSSACRNWRPSWVSAVIQNFRTHTQPFLPSPRIHSEKITGTERRPHSCAGRPPTRGPRSQPAACRCVLLQK